MQPGNSMERMPLLEDDDRLALKGVVIDRPKGFLLFAEGERTSETFLILKGHVKVSSGGADRIVAIRGPGEVVGEMAALDGEPRSASVYAIEDISVLIVSRADWIAFLYSRPRVFHALVQMLSDRVRETTTKQSQVSWINVEQRLAERLLELGEKIGHTGERGIIINGVSQSELAGLAGTRRDRVAQVMRAFRSMGVVSTSRQEVVVSNPELLRNIADGNATAL